MTNVTDETLGRLARQQHDLFRRVREGTLDAGAVFAAHQALNEGRFPAVIAAVSTTEPGGIVDTSGVPVVFANYDIPGLPEWYVDPNLQLERLEAWLRSLGFGQGDIPTSGPMGIAPTRNALVLLRAVLPGTRRVGSRRRTTGVHMDAIEAQLREAGYKSRLWDGFKAFREDPWLAAGLSDPEPGVSWVLFDPFAHWDPKGGHRVTDLESVQDGWPLAGIENLSALRAWPGYGPAMDGTKTPHINLAGLRTTSGGVPYVGRWVDVSRLGFSVHSAGGLDHFFSSPRFSGVLGF